MKFKDLPLSIQEIAAQTLRQRLNELALESVTKKDTDNMARNVRDAFIGLYSVSVTNNGILKKLQSGLPRRWVLCRGKVFKKKNSGKWPNASQSEVKCSLHQDSFYNEKTDNSCLRDLLSLLDKFGIIMTGTALADFTYSAICHNGEPCPPELIITPAIIRG